MLQWTRPHDLSLAGRLCQSAQLKVSDLSARHKLDEGPEMATDILSIRELVLDVLRRNGINASEHADEQNRMLSTLQHLNLPLTDRQAAGQVLCIVMVLHMMISGGSMGKQ